MRSSWGFVEYVGALFSTVWSGHSLLFLGFAFHSSFLSSQLKSPFPIPPPFPPPRPPFRPPPGPSAGGRPPGPMAAVPSRPWCWPSLKSELRFVIAQDISSLPKLDISLCISSWDQTLGRVWLYRSFRHCVHIDMAGLAKPRQGVNSSRHGMQARTYLLSHTGYDRA